ncbi:MAG: acyltransferase [Planctomycetota bacterium]
MVVFRYVHGKLVDEIDLHGEPLERTRLSEREALTVLVRIARGFVRGLFLRLRARHAKGHVLVGRRVRVLDAQHLTLGRRVKIEDDVELQCRSQRGVVLGDRVTIGRGASIRPSSYYGHVPGEGLVVGAGSAVGALAWIGASGHVSIGADVLIGPRVTILPENHVFERTAITIKSQGVQRARVVIEDDCWIGAGVVVLAGVRIGRGSVVAAGAVVARDVDPYSVVGGVPARHIKERKVWERERHAA